MRLFALFLLTYANLSQALGIGDIALKSHLGEPLAAVINVTDVEKSPDAGCFSVRGISDNLAFKKAAVTLKANSNGYQLNISTHDVITEPIINLQVSFHCEPNFNREYILLLDPVSLTSLNNATDSAGTGTTEKSAASNDVIVNTDGKNKSPKPQSHFSRQSDSDADTASVDAPVDDKAAKKKKFKKKASAESSIDKKLMEAYTGKQQTATAEPITQAKISGNIANAKQADTQANPSRHYLVISSGNVNANGHSTQPGLSLRLETQIDFARAEAKEPLTVADAMDEVTVMANRLVHLEKQIISLQNRNAQLLNEAERAKTEAKNAGFRLSEQQSQWLQNILVALGIIIILAGSEWLRRKSTRNRLDREQAIWFDAEENAAKHNESSIISANDFKSLDDDLMDEAAFGQSTSNNLHHLNNTNALLLTENANDEHENILENADVFIEHGRPALAIQLLQNHLIDFPSESPKIWLRLLSLIATEGSQTEYDHTVAECRQFFNIKMPGFAEAGSEDLSSIEDFPHIIARLEGVWGSQYAVGFLNDLIYNQQSQPREGFGRGTFEELFFLKQVAEILNAHTSKEQTDFYQPAAIKPKLDSVAFNEVAFSNTKVANDANVSSEAESPSNEAKCNDAENEKKKLDTPLNKLSSSLENSAFQTVPSYEVDMLLDFNEALNIKNNASQNALNEVLIPSSDTPAEITTPEVAKTLQADEIHFSMPMLDSSEIIDAIEESEATKKSNVIEWDLPEKN